jgi:shikimate dehydrogenase
LTVTSTQTRLAVLGSPIGHSRSPALHRAAYEVLGLDWQYEAAEVTGDSLAGFLAARDDRWRGLSLTMPLKRDILPLLDRIDPLVEQTGSANTVLFDRRAGGRDLVGFNTDVYGITQAFERSGHHSLGVVQILGGGATAASAIAAAGRLSARTVFVSVRSPERAQGLVAVGRAHGIEVVIGTLAESIGIGEAPDAVISTLPNGSDVELSFAPETVRHAVLFDVAYHPWPSALAARWGAEVISGLEMLVLQALAQVRVFVHGDPERVLDDETSVLAAMRAAVGL